MPARDLISALHRDPLSDLSRERPLLLVDDNLGDRRLIIELLSEVGVPESVVLEAEDLEAALELLGGQAIGAVLLDLGLPGIEGVEAVRAVVARHQVPIVVLTGRDDHSLALMCIKAGAQDYLPKNNLQPAAIRRAVAYAMTRAEIDEERRNATAISERLAAIVNAAPDAIASVALDGTIQSWNSGAERIFGYSAEEALGRKIAEVAPPVDTISEQGQRESLTLDAESLAKPREILRRRRDGSVACLSIVGCAIYDATGKQNGMAAIARDITDERRRDQALVQSHQALKERAEQMRALTRRMNDLREEERTRISREVHDELGQLLTCLKLDLGWVRRHLVGDEEGAIEQRLTQADTLVDDTISAVQKVALELRPSALDSLGLAAAIRDEARRFADRSGIRVMARVDDPTVPTEVATELFRILQELQTNVARHAKASVVQVMFQDLESEWELRVIDDGIGIDPHVLEDGAALGLLGVRERALSLGGEVTFSRAIPSGTVAVVRIPKKNGAER
ncbi:MAG: PAS domain S-box protein [Myxococcales bacterium]|nr:PAS domain S-box protein [Myxococcales bacterium]